MYVCVCVSVCVCVRVCVFTALYFLEQRSPFLKAKFYVLLPYRRTLYNKRKFKEIQELDEMRWKKFE